MKRHGRAPAPLHRRRWFPPEGAMGWIAFGALALLWLVAAGDAGLWLARMSGRFFAKANFASHFWSYISLAGLLVGLLARGVPNALRSLPTAWLVLSLVVQHHATFFPHESLPPPAGPLLRVMTFNLGESEVRRRAASAFFRTRREVDVLFLQEVAGTERQGDRPRMEAALGRRLPHGAWRMGSPRTRRRFGLGIMSRYPLEGIQVIRLPPGPAPEGICHETDALTAKMRIRGRIVRLATTHLCPPRMPWRDSWNRRVGFSLSNLWDWLGTLRRYEYARRSQLIYLRLIAEGGTEPFVLGGSLNTTPKSLDLLRLSQRLRSAFDERGLGLGFTYYVAGLGARIDHIFYSGSLRARSAEVVDVDISDHRPLEAVLEILPREGPPPA